jgi:hypothetical protein
MMTESTEGVVAVTRRIKAPVEQIFALIADPQRHPGFDGSDMLRDGGGNATVCAVGDDYEVNRRIVWEPALNAASRSQDMADVGQRAGHRWGYQLEPDGDATVVTEIFDCSRAPGWLREAVNDGNQWVASMTATLELLEQQCGRQAARRPTS